MIFEELEKTGLTIVDDASLSAFIDFLMERVYKVIDNSTFIRPEFKERIKIQIYSGVHK